MSASPLPGGNRPRSGWLARGHGLFTDEPIEELHRVSRIACDLFGCEAAFVAFREDERTVLKGWGGIDGPPDLSTIHPVDLPRGAEVLSVESASKDSRVRLVLAIYPETKEFAVAPVRLGDGSRIGLLAVLSRSDKHFDQASLARLEEYASHVSFGVGAIVAGNQAHQANELLAERERHLRAVLESFPDLIFRLSRNGEYRDVHAPDRELLATKDLIGKSLSDVLEPNLAATFVRNIRRALETQTLRYLEYELPTAGKGLRYFEARIMPCADDEVVFTVRDITERRDSASQLEAREALLDAVMRATIILLTRPSLSVAVHEAFSILGSAVDVDRVYLFENHTGSDGVLYCSQRFEWTRDKVSTEIENPVLQNMAYDKHFPAWRDAMEKGEPVAEIVATLDSGLRSVMQDQEIKALLLVPLLQNGEFIGFVGFDDCRQERVWTEMERSVLMTAAAGLGGAIMQRKARFEIGSSRARYKALVDNVNDVIFQTDRTGALSFLSHAWEGVSGHRVDAARGRHLREFVIQDDIPILDRCTIVLLNEEVPECRHDIRLICAGGGQKWVQLYARVSYGENGEVSGLFGTLHDVTERRRYEDALVAAKERAEEMAALKSSFLANMSHEIRTPLTSILGFSQILFEEVEGEKREMIDLIVRNGHRLMETLDSVLELARLESAGIKLNVRPVRIDREVQEMVNLFGHRTIETGVDLRCEVNGPLVCYTDASLLRRVLTNLVGNAVKFTTEGEVVIGVASDADMASITVRDTGVGIEEHFLDSLFDDFTQESSGLDRRYEGSGLGLSITKRLVRLLGATIHVESEKGVGSSFTVELPRRPNLTLGGVPDSTAVEVRSERN